MQLNEQLPGLPPWPPIKLVQEREYVVGGPNLSYPGYDRGRKTLGVLWMGSFIGSLVVGFGYSQALGALLFLLCFATPLLLVFFLGMKFICEKLFSSEVKVRFTPDFIFVNGQKYENAPDIPVQFRAQRTPLSDKQIQRNNKLLQQGKLPKGRAYDFKFRKVEMIYGSRIILVTSVADEDRAEQFAVALQIGHDLAASSPIKPAGRPAAKALPKEDALPE